MLQHLDLDEDVARFAYFNRKLKKKTYFEKTHKSRADKTTKTFSCYQVVRYFPSGIQWEDVFAGHINLDLDIPPTEEEMYNISLDFFDEEIAQALTKSRKIYQENLAAAEEEAASTDSEDRAMEQDLFGSDDE